VSLSNVEILASILRIGLYRIDVDKKLVSLRRPGWTLCDLVGLSACACVCHSICV